MKRTILPGLVTVLIVAVSASGLLFGKQDRIPIHKPLMVLVCHHANPSAPGVVISVPHGTLKIHESHGDHTVFSGAQIGSLCSLPYGHPSRPKGVGGKPKTP